MWRIRDKFVGFGFFIIFLTTLALGVINYINSYNTLSKAFEEKSSSVIDSVKFSLNNFMKELEDILYMVDRSGNVETKPNKEEEAKFVRYIENIMLTHEKVMTIYYSTVDGYTLVAPLRSLPKGYDPRSSLWYKEAIEKQGIIWTEAYADIFTGEKVITVAKPLYDSGQVIGVLAIDVGVNTITEYLSNIKLGTTGYFMMVGSKNNVMMHPNSKLLGNPVPVDKLDNALREQKKGSVFYFYEGAKKHAVFNTIDKMGWKLIGIIEVSESLKDANRILRNTILAGAIILLISLILGLFMTNKITINLKALVEDIQRIESGYLVVRSNINAKDESGVIAKQLNRMIDKLNLVMDSTSDAIWEYNLEKDRMTILSKYIDTEAYEEENKYSSIRHMLEYIHPEDKEKVKAEYFNFINGGTELFLSEFRLKKKDSSYFWVTTRGKVIERREHKIIRISGSMTDITQKKEYEDRIYHMAFYDNLTNLPNSLLFREELKHYIEANNSSKAAILLIDLDDFKKINDTLGHGFGDKLIKKLGKRIESLKSHRIVVSRTGGDEFLILLKDVKEDNELMEVGENIKEALKLPIAIENNNIATTVSIGISMYPDHGQDVDSLISNADIAMYSAKSSGKNKIHVFNELMYNDFNRKVEIENCLKQGLYEEEFEIYYQPQIDMESKDIRGFEALLRWNSKALGRVSPAEFISVAEQSGEIIPIGKWAINEVFTHTKALLKAGYNFQRISINISTVQLLEENLINNIKEAMDSTALEAKYIEFEVTESVLINDKEESIAVLSKLKEMGFNIALDDFGTGYSSLSYLKILPVDVLKIDKSFIDNLTTEPRTKALIKSIIELSHNLGIEVVAEGVECYEQLSLLKNISCDIIQGYYFSKPLPYEEVRSIYDNIKMKEI